MTRLLSCPDEVVRRRDLLAEPHLLPLASILADLRSRRGEVPDPDPLDGGVDARLLLLLETPGPRIRSSGFVSRDNPSGTGRNLRALLDTAALARRDVLIWNAVPWVIHAEGARNRAPTRTELREGAAELPPLLACLDRLRVVVLAGRSAQAARPIVAAARPDVTVLAMPHPSPTIQCTSPAVRARSADALARAAALLAARPIASDVVEAA